LRTDLDLLLEIVERRHVSNGTAFERADISFTPRSRVFRRGDEVEPRSGEHDRVAPLSSGTSITFSDNAWSNVSCTS
jgi:hypothetical protein